MAEERYDPKRPCPKCGGNEHRVRHCEGCFAGGNYGKMQRVCARCGFCYYELPLDYVAVRSPREKKGAARG